MKLLSFLVSKINLTATAKSGFRESIKVSEVQKEIIYSAFLTVCVTPIIQRNLRLVLFKPMLSMIVQVSLFTVTMGVVQLHIFNRGSHFVVVPESQRSSIIAYFGHYRCIWKERKIIYVRIITERKSYQ